MQLLAAAKIDDAFHDPQRSSGVIEVGGAHLYGAGAGDDEFQGVLGAGDAARSDEGIFTARAAWYTMRKATA